MKDVILRIYEGVDTFMLESSEVMQAALVDDLADFNAFDTTIDATFLANWATANTAARDTTTDFTVVGEQKDRTALVNAAMQQCRDAYNDIMYFAKKAFKNNADLLLKFGRGNTYQSARQNQPKMVELMEEMAKNVITYTSQLSTAGASATVLGAPAAAFTALSALNISQNTQIKDRRLFSRERIEAYNTAYTIMALVGDAAQSVYRSNADKRNIYTYNPPSTNLKTLNLTIQPGAMPIVALKIEYKPERDLRIKTTLPIDIAISQDGINPGVNGWLPVPAGPTNNGEMEDLGPAGDYILMRNIGTGAQPAEVIFKYEEN